MAVFIRNIQHSFHEFFSHGYVQVFRFLYGSAQFPYWFAIQSVWSCYAVHRSAVGHRRSMLLGLKKLLLAALMTFASREICAVVLRVPSPVVKQPITLGIFAAAFVLLSFCPGDLVYKVLTLFYNVIGSAQAFNVFRFYRLMMRKLRTSDRHKLFVAVAFAAADQLFAIVLRPIFKFSHTSIASIASVCFTLTACLAHFMLTHRNRFTPWIGLRTDEFTSIAVAFALGLINTAAAMSKPAASPPPARNTDRQPEPEDDEPAEEANLRDFEGSWTALTATVEAHKGLVVIEIGAAWSRAAVDLSSMLPTVAAEFPSVLFLKVDTGNTKNHEVVRRFPVSRLPHVEVVKCEQTFARLRTQEGCDAQTLRKALSELLAE